MNGGDVLGLVLWPVAFIAAFMPIYFCTAAGVAETLGRAGVCEVDSVRTNSDTGTAQFCADLQFVDFE